MKNFKNLKASLNEDRKKDLKDLETLSIAYKDQLDKGKKDNAKKLDIEIKKLAKKLGVKEEVEEAKAPKMKGLSIYGSEISGLKYKNGTYSAKAVVYGSNKLGYRVRNEFGDFETLDLKTFAKRFG